MRGRYAELLSDALKIDVTPTNYIADIDSGFYVSSYLRSWAFEAQLRAYLKEKFGSKWFATREAGSLLRELWGEGQKMRAEEMLKEVTGSTLEMEAVADRVQGSAITSESFAFARGIAGTPRSRGTPTGKARGLLLGGRPAISLNRGGTGAEASAPTSVRLRPSRYASLSLRPLKGRRTRV